MTKRNDSRNSTSGSAKLARFINKKWSSKVLERSRAACGMNPRKIFSPHPPWIVTATKLERYASRKMRACRLVVSIGKRSRGESNEDRERERADLGTCMNETIKQ